MIIVINITTLLTIYKDFYMLYVTPLGFGLLISKIDMRNEVMLMWSGAAMATEGFYASLLSLYRNAVSFFLSTHCYGAPFLVWHLGYLD